MVWIVIILIAILAPSLFLVPFSSILLKFVPAEEQGLVALEIWKEEMVDKGLFCNIAEEHYNNKKREYNQRRNYE